MKYSKAARWLLFLISVLLVCGIILCQRTHLNSEQAQRLGLLEGAYRLLEELEGTGPIPSAATNYIILPVSLRKLPDEERSRLLRKYLSDEITREGLNWLVEEGTVLSLAEAYPTQGHQWATQVGVEVEDCVVLCHTGKEAEDAYVAICTNAPNGGLIIRLDNVRVPGKR